MCFDYIVLFVDSSFNTSIVYYCTKKKSKELATPELSLEIIERHKSEAEIEHAFNGSNFTCCNQSSCLRIYSIYGHIGIIATIGMFFLVHNGTSIAFLSYGNTFVLFMDIILLVSWMIIFIFLYEIFFSNECDKLGISWTKKNYSITQHLNDLIRTPPKITMKFEMCHYESDGDGGQYKVIDLVLEKPFIFSRW